MNRAVSLSLSIIVASTSLVAATSTAASTPGEDGPPAPRINWSPCYQKLAGDINVDMAALGQPAVAYECATVPVPLDYDRPRGPTISLALVRLPAAGTDDDRIGSLFLNPGGPGGSGVDFALFFGPFAGLELRPEVRGQFDIVGFDPRGVGRSSAVKCFGNERQAEQAFAPAAYPLTADEVEAQIAADGVLAETCDRGARRPSENMSTANVARDMDLLRRALGDDGLNYLGLSYGSYLGTVYANLFPDAVRAMVIDGVLDPVGWANESAQMPFSTVLRSDLGARATLQRFFDLCDATPADGGGSGTCLISDGSPDNAADRFAAVIDRLKTTPLQVTSPDGETFVLSQQDVIAITLSILYNPFDFYFLGEFLSVVEGGTAPDVGLALQRLERETALVNKRGFPAYVNFAESFPAVACSDTRNPTDYQAWVSTGIADPDEYFATIWDWASSPCAQWPRDDTDRYDGGMGFGAVTSNPVLVIGNSADPATRLEGAQAAATVLGNSTLLTVDEPGHTSLGISPLCAGPATGGYLLAPDQDLSAPLLQPGNFCPSLVDISGGAFNWINLGAPPPALGSSFSADVRVGGQVRDQVLDEVAYMPSR